MNRPFRFGLQAKGPPDPVGLRRLARKAEDLGWSTLTMADHLDEALAPIPALVLVAGATSTLRVGTMVLCNDLRHPVVAAKDAATLDVLSDGRLELGLGAGWQTSDYGASGIPFDPASIRIARLEEAVETVTALFTEGVTTISGETYRITSLDGGPRPAQRPRPPIVVGGGGERILRLAARRADVVALNVNLAAGVIDERAFPDGTPEATDRKVAWIRDEAGERFDDLELQARIHLAAITDDYEGFVEQTAPAFGLTPAQARGTPHALAGSVGQICEQLLERRARWGISYLTLGHDQLEAFAPVIAALT